MDNYEAMKPWEHGKIVEIHHDIKSISVYPVVYENKDFYVCRLSGSTEIITIRKNSYQNYVFESYEKYMSWRRNNPLASLNSRRFFVYIPKEGKISFADNFPVRDSLDEALAKETDNDKKAEMAYATAAALMQAKKLSQARSYCQKAMSFKENYGEPYILLAQLYGSNPNWTDEPALNKCTYFVVIDKLQRAKAVDPSVTERANELISTYSRHTPQAKDLFMLGYKAGDRITIGGWIGESTTIR